MATMIEDVKRIRSLIDGIASHCETVAKDYANAVQRHGKPFTDALVSSGLERDWLNCLEDVGRGFCAGGLLFLSADKRNALRCQDLPTQTNIITNGVRNKPLDKASIDDLRSVLGTQKHVKMTKRVPVAVKSHIRTRPTPTKTKPVVSGYGIAITEARVYSWLEIAAIIEQNAESIPVDVADRIARAVDLTTA